MNIKSSVFIATSLDGFIANHDGNIDWLNEASKLAPPGEDCGYQEFINSVDVLVMGRNSYKKVSGFKEWPYKEKPVVVLSSKSVPIPTKLQKTVSSSSETPFELTRRLSDEGAKHLYIDGGITIQRFLAAGLIDELTITVIPLLIGTGKPLFGPTQNNISLIHLETKSYDFGFVQLKYRVEKTDCHA
ncbi:Dihydrofolate reductase [hydrothermal vent metagenome]|uniref:Dihydrofolate reductase n=1 Tax=hydrothermal vent metagenome TaxID=652676 RepID=A0A3B1CD79_9ZZZZ